MGRKELNPADVYRKQQRKKELKKCKETRNVVRSVQELLSDPNKIEEEIQKAQKESDASALDKGLKDRIKELKMMKSVALTKQKIDIASGKADRDSAAALREAEIQQRDLQRDRRRGLIPNDPTDSSKKANGGENALDTYQKKEETSSSSKEKISDNTSQAPTQQQPLQQQPPQQQPPQQQYQSMQQHAVQQPITSAFGIAPMLNFPPTSMLPQPPSFRPPPPPPPPRAVTTIIPPPLFQPPPSFPDSLLLKPAPPVLVPLPAVGIAVGLSPMVPPPAPPVFIRPATIPAISHENDEETLPAPAPVSVAPSPSPYTAEEAPKIEVENTVSSFPFSFSAANFKLPTAEELMKRRHALTADAEAVVEYDDNNSGVSYPMPEAPRAQEQSTYEPQMPSYPVEMITEIKESENAFFPKKRSIYIPPAVVAPKVSSGLGGLADYGSDSDDDDGDGDTAKQADAAPAVTAAPRFIPLAFPLQLSTYETRPMPEMQRVPFPAGSEQIEDRPLPLSLPHSTSSNSVSDDVAVFLDSIAQDDIATLIPSDRAMGYQSTIRDPVPVADRPPPKPLLKTIKADSALTAFRPNALRVKRPALQTGKISVKMPRVDGDSGIQVQGLSTGSGSSNSAPSGEGVERTEGRAPALSGGVEDAYLNFLDEIGEMTG